MRRYKGTYSGHPVIMVINGEMADGSKTYIRQEYYDTYGIESDGYLRQYQKDRQNRFYLMTEDKMI